MREVAVLRDGSEVDVTSQDLGYGRGPEDVRLIRVTVEALEMLAGEMHCDLEWGQPDADGVYVPRLTRRMVPA